eukprot:SAG11_NODE_31484_length_291_cov_1.072917_1_plen_35_part_01
MAIQHPALGGVGHVQSPETSCFKVVAFCHTFHYTQ